ncbi:MAG TPA: hypothetical protein VEE86_02935 [Thermoplasmata archaeon]|nr:hypothetical protein [Thermoplasmata archaeon]
MPYLADRAARLYYDDACGPCRLLARTTESVSRHRVVATPLVGPAADTALGGLPETTRFGSAHLASGGAVRSGGELVAPLVGLTLGRSWERVVRGAPFLERSLRSLYLRLQTARNSRGCGTVVSR